MGLERKNILRLLHLSCLWVCQSSPNSITLVLHKSNKALKHPITYLLNYTSHRLSPGHHRNTWNNKAKGCKKHQAGQTSTVPTDGVRAHTGAGHTGTQLWEAHRITQPSHLTKKSSIKHCLLCQKLAQVPIARHRVCRRISIQGETCCCASAQPWLLPAWHQTCTFPLLLWFHSQNLNFYC